MMNGLLNVAYTFRTEVGFFLFRNITVLTFMVSNKFEIKLNRAQQKHLIVF